MADSVRCRVSSGKTGIVPPVSPEEPELGRHATAFAIRRADGEDRIPLPEKRPTRYSGDFRADSTLVSLVQVCDDSKRPDRLEQLREIAHLEPKSQKLIFRLRRVLGNMAYNRDKEAEKLLNDLPVVDALALKLPRNAVVPFVA